jgi:hypothetical protein
LKTIVYHQRLGDVLQCLPAARYLAQHDEVQIECLPQYAGVMDLVSYATWVAPGEGTGERIELEIWPNRYNAFRQSGLSWMDFVYQHPAIAEADRKIVLDRVPDGPPVGLPDKYNLLAPHGISHGWHYPLNKIMQKAEEMIGSYFLMHAPCHCYYSVPHWSAGSIVEMAQAIKHANLFMAINSAPIVMASALRQDGKETFYLPQKGQWAQDNVAPWPGRVDVEL